MLTCNLSTVRILAKKATIPCMIMLVITCLMKVAIYSTSSMVYHSEEKTTTGSSSSLRALEITDELPTTIPPVVIKTLESFDTALRRMYNHEIGLCDGDSAVGTTCSTNEDCLYDQSCIPVALDPFHVRKLFPSDRYNVENDWFDSWSYSESAEKVIAGPSTSDPRVTFFGNQNYMEQTSKGVIFDGTKSTAVMDSVFGMLVSSNYPETKGFDNVEFTTYVKIPSLEEGGKKLVSLWARANNHIEGHKNCNSLLGYVALWDIVTGEIKFQKHHGGGVATDFIVSETKMIPQSSDIWYGIKFIVSTLPNSQDVHLEFYMDGSHGANGGVWTLMHNYVDRPNEWMADEGERGHTSTHTAVECNTEVIPDGSTVLGPTHGCALEFMGQSKIAFKDVSIRNILKKTQHFCNDHPHLAIPCYKDDDCMDHGQDSKCHEYGLDRFGLKKISHNSYDRVTAKLLDWTSTWDLPYVNKEYTALIQPGNQDPYDARTAHRGIGTIAFAPEGEIHMRHQTRLFISKPMGYNIPGWDNVEFTAYGKILQDGGDVSPTSGLEMVVRSNYDAHDGCHAAAYVARLHRATGQASFQKLYYDHLDYGRIETVSRRSDPLEQTEGGLPKDVWIGMKFVVYTYSQGDGTAVQLDLYVDTTQGKYGGDWQLVHSTIDYPGTWMAASTQSLSNVCDPNVLKDGDTILGPRKDCFLMVNGTPDTIVAWKQASIRSIAPHAPHVIS